MDKLFFFHEHLLRNQSDTIPKPSMDSRSKAAESATECLAVAASIATSAMLARTVINEFLPNEPSSFVSTSFNKLFARFSKEQTIIIRQTEGLVSNELYEAARTYLRTKISPTMRRLKANKNKEGNNIIVSIDDGEVLADKFDGVQYKWQLIIQKENSSSRFGESSIKVRGFEVSFHNKYKEAALGSYFPHILDRSKEIKAMDKRLKLYMNVHDSWKSIYLHHPATMDTLAMEAGLKRTIIEDLERFVKRKEYYKKIGKAWKRGYLLFGPPGTGKSSLIAAIANYLSYDIYDLDLNHVYKKGYLKRLLVKMSNKSMLVIEDIDCAIDLENKEEEGEDKESSHFEEVTLSGLLNFIDGLWSSSREEWIIVLTTNYKDRLNPAFLRPGRMDMHIHLGYCGPNSFRVLASNYHAVNEHPLFEEIEGLLKEVEATPAEVTEELLRSDDVDSAMGRLILFLQNKKREAEGNEENKQEDVEIEQMHSEKQLESEIGARNREADDVIFIDKEWLKVV